MRYCSAGIGLECHSLHAPSRTETGGYFAKIRRHGRRGKGMKESMFALDHGAWAEEAVGGE